MDWLLPSLVFAAVSGLIGVSTKLALRDLPPLNLFLWAAFAYAIAAAGALTSGISVDPLAPGVPWAIASGILASAALLIRFKACAAVRSAR